MKRYTNASFVIMMTESNISVATLMIRLIKYKYKKLTMTNIFNYYRFLSLAGNGNTLTKLCIALSLIMKMKQTWWVLDGYAHH